MGTVKKTKRLASRVGRPPAWSGFTPRELHRERRLRIAKLRRDLKKAIARDPETVPGIRALLRYELAEQRDELRDGKKTRYRATARSSVRTRAKRRARRADGTFAPARKARKRVAKKKITTKDYPRVVAKRRSRRAATEKRTKAQRALTPDPAAYSRGTWRKAWARNRAYSVRAARPKLGRLKRAKAKYIVKEMERDLAVIKADQRRLDNGKRGTRYAAKSRPTIRTRARGVKRRTDGTAIPRRASTKRAKRLKATTTRYPASRSVPLILPEKKTRKARAPKAPKTARAPKPRATATRRRRALRGASKTLRKTARAKRPAKPKITRATATRRRRALRGKGKSLRKTARKSA